jgi:hypothetical protein
MADPRSWEEKKKRRLSQGVVVGLASADAPGAFNGADENLAVADLAGVGRRADRLDGAFLGRKLTTYSAPR